MSDTHFIRVFQKSDIPLVTVDYETMRRILLWYDIQNGYLSFCTCDWSSRYYRFCCIHKNCAFKCLVRRVPNPLFSNLEGFYVIGEYVAHTCTPLKSKPLDFPLNATQLKDDSDSPYSNSTRVFGHLTPYTMNDNQLSNIVKLPEGRIFTEAQVLELSKELKFFFRIHPRFTKEVDNELQIPWDKYRYFGLEPEKVIQNIHLPALHIKLFSPDTSIFIKYDDNIHDTVRVPSDNTSDLSDVEDEECETYEPEMTEDIMIKRNHAVLLEMEVDSKETWNEGYGRYIDEHKHPKPSPSTKQVIVVSADDILKSFNDGYRGEKEMVNRLLKLGQMDKGKFPSNTLKSDRDQYMTYHIMGESKSEYSICYSSPPSSSSSLPAFPPPSKESIVSSLNSAFKSVSTFKDSTPKDPTLSLYQTQPQVAEYLEEKKQTVKLWDDDRSFCQKHGCQLEPEKVYCKDPLHTLFTASDQIDKHLKFPYSVLLHLIQQWFPSPVNLKESSVTSYFHCSPSMKKILPIIDPVITIDATVIRKNIYGKYLLVMAVAQTPTYTAHILAFGFYSIESKHNYLSFFKDFKKATGDFLNTDVSFITDANKELHSAMKSFFPNNVHYPCFQNLIDNAAKMFLIPGADRKRFLGLIFKLQICAFKDQSDEYLREMHGMIDHEKYATIETTTTHVEGEILLKSPSPSESKLTYNILMDKEKVSWAHSPTPRFNQGTSDLFEATKQQILDFPTLDPLNVMYGIHNKEIMTSRDEYSRFFCERKAGKFIDDEEYLIPGITDNLANALVHINKYKPEKIDTNSDHSKAVYEVNLIDENFLRNLKQRNFSESVLDYLYGSCNRPFSTTNGRKVTALRVERMVSAFSRRKYIVDFEKKECECGYWQNNQYPCVHVLAIAMQEKLAVSSLCSERYFLKNQIKVFNEILDKGKEELIEQPSLSEIRIIQTATKDITPTGDGGFGTKDWRTADSSASEQDNNTLPPPPPRRRVGQQTCKFCLVAGHSLQICPNFCTNCYTEGHSREYCYPA